VLAESGSLEPAILSVARSNGLVFREYASTQSPLSCRQTTVPALNNVRRS
jgi:hypothetical protein